MPSSNLMNLNSFKLFLICLTALAIISCDGGKMESMDRTVLPSIKDVPADSWQRLSQKKIFFGHQSVGFNIVDGIKGVMKENPQIKLNIVETNSLADFGAPLFAHSPVGKNMDPQSKCDAFAGFMNAGLGDKADIAFFKLCYVDVSPGMDTGKLVAHYKNAMLTLKSKYPRTAFVHVTVPLTTIEPGLRHWIKRYLSKAPEDYKTNVEREQFNQALRNEYTGKEPIFDLALIESTLPNGARETFEKDGKVYPRLVPAYTTDGGHLNEMGRRLVAEQLLIFLAKLSG